ANTRNTIYVHLADGSDPNQRRIRIPAHNTSIHFWGTDVNHIVVRGLGLRLAMAAISISNDPAWSSNITLDTLDISRNKLASITSDFCTHHVRVLNSHIHDMEYEGIHLESDDSVLDN